MNEKVKYVLLVILIILIAINPSIKDFKEHLSLRSDDYPKRGNNFFICSIYSNYGVTYFAIAGNFFKITHHYKLDITQIREDALKTQADSASLMSDTSDTFHGRISGSAFAERIKSRFPEYQAIDNAVLIRKVIEKYPDYKDKIDTLR